MASDDQVLIFDTTLRDGEQAPGASMTVDQKLEVALLLDQANVDIIEAGFPIASPSDFKAVNQIAQGIRSSAVAALCRAKKADIEACGEALKPARRPRIHTFISTSPIHMEHKLQMSPDAVLEAVADSVRYARGFCDDVEWSCEDGTRSDFEFLCRCFDTAIRMGARTVNIADTVGYTTPEEFFDLITRLRNSVVGMEKVRFSVHCHDDLGMATANSLAAIRAGARQVECTVNGVGERAGNAALEEIVMALKVRSDAFGPTTGIRTEKLTEASKLVAKYTGFTVAPNKAVVGANAFAHESGIHQHGVIKNRNTYEIIAPEEVGSAESLIVMGKHSGRHGLRMKIKGFGIELGENSFEEVYCQFINLAESKKTVSDEEILGLVKKIAAE